KVKISKNIRFIKKRINAPLFKNIIQDYTGYVLCVEEDFLKEEIEMMREIFEYIEGSNQCILLDLTVNSKKELDLELINNIGICTIPSIIKINSRGIKEVINLNSFPAHYTNKQIISEIKILLNRDDN
ncbi:hypothetical protein, partial [Bacillus velezensis]